MDTKPTSILPKLRAFLKQLRVLAWFEIFEKWFSVGVKFLWMALFITFGIYLRKEYKKDIYYMKDFKVPVSWVERGYTGEVVKEAILDEIDAIDQENWPSFGSGDVQTIRYKDTDNTEFLSELSVQGFNLKAIVNSTMALLGKKNKNIGGYVVLSDTTQTLVVQITDQLATKVNISHKAPIQAVIHAAALQIMRVKLPTNLALYYNSKGDNQSIVQLAKFLKQNKTAIPQLKYFYIQFLSSLVKKDYKKATAWSDSLLLNFPNEMRSYETRAYIYRYRLYFEKDTLKKIKLGNQMVSWTKKAIEHNVVEGKTATVNDLYLDLADYYIRNNNLKLGEENLTKGKDFLLQSPYYSNKLGYAYISQKDYKIAEIYIKKAVDLDEENSNYLDSMAELCVLQGKDSLAVIYIEKALNAPKATILVSKKNYQKDVRWVNLKTRKDFQKLVK